MSEKGKREKAGRREKAGKRERTERSPKAAKAAKGTKGTKAADTAAEARTSAAAAKGPGQRGRRGADGSGGGSSRSKDAGRSTAGSGAGSGSRPDALRRYREKRHFARTAEPSGAPAPSEGTGSFVVQIHDASTMHFDFRLEVDGVLKSWSVPKGPSPDPREKRLAMPTEDHPLEYREFEGVIPSGEYGAGAVIVWDEGTYRPLSEDFAKGLERGHVTFRLSGSKLRGGYALTRFRGGGDGGDGREAWLLVKRDDERAAREGRTPDPQRARSARTGRTLRQVAAEGEGEGP